MEKHNIQIIAGVSSKLLLRNRVFQLSFLIITVCITFFHVMEQSEWAFYAFPGEFNLACSIPYMNAYLFTLLQIFPLLFSVTTLGRNDEKLDSMDAVYYRRESNVEYVWGITLGYSCVFIIMAMTSLVLGVLIHLIGNNAPLNFGHYLFYLVTLTFPAYVFSFGICLLVKSLVRQRVLSLTLLMLYFTITIFFVGDKWGGIFDFTGTTLPNAFSEIDGHPEIVRYLVQRFAWLMIGLGCILLSVRKFKRIPNTPKRTKLTIAVCVAWGAGIAMLCGIVLVNHGEYAVRQKFREVYEKYNRVKPLALLSQDINFKQTGCRMEVNCRLHVKNQTGGKVSDIVLYLNPGLEVASVRVEEKDVPFSRDHQAIVVSYPVNSGDSLLLQITYMGNIDEKICYLDMPEDVTRDTWQRRYLTCRFGKRYAFLDERFTLLTPEVLWYPMTKPLVNVGSSPYERNKDFTRYTLNVMTPGGKTVISQGYKEIREDRTSFRNDLPVEGISLCMGDYETRSMTVDSVVCNLHVFRRRSSFFDVIDSCENSLDTGKSEFWKFKGRSYPFPFFSLVETPVSFTAYFREERVSSEYVQPELVFLPERLAGQVDSPERFKELPEYTPSIDLKNLTSILTDNAKVVLCNSWINGMIFKRNMKDFLLNTLRSTNNPYYVYPLFFEYDAFLQSEDYLALNAMNKYIVDGAFTRYDVIGGMKATVWEALDYLDGHCLREALDDRALDPEVLQDVLTLKSLELVNYFNYHGVDLDDLKSFISGYLKRHQFESVDFSRFNAAFREKFGIDGKSVLPACFTGTRIPVYLIQDFHARKVFHNGPYSACAMLVEFSIFNDSDVDGIISLQTSVSPFYSGGIIAPSLGEYSVKQLRKPYLIKARTGKKVSLYLPESLPYVGLNTGISRNIPRIVSAFDESVERIERYEEYVESVEKEEFLPGENEIVVDNTDDGFRVVENLRFNLRQWLAGNTVTAKQVKPANLYGYVMLNDEWKTLAEDNAYGQYCRSLVARNSGNGQSALEWSATLTRNGQCEILVYLPEFRGTNIMLQTAGHAKIVGKQEYTVTLPSGDVKVVWADNKDVCGWISLGIFDCTPGKCKVALSDKGAADYQIVIGDAVKWKYMGRTPEAR